MREKMWHGPDAKSRCRVDGQQFPAKRAFFPCRSKPTKGHLTQPVIIRSNSDASHRVRAVFRFGPMPLTENLTHIGLFKPSFVVDKVS